MGGIGVEGLVEREVGRGVVEGQVERGSSGGVGLGESRNEFLEVALALSGGDGRTGAIVVVEGLDLSDTT